MRTEDFQLVDLKANEIIRTRNYRREDYSPFSMIGVLRDMNNKDTQLPDILDILEKVPKGAFSLFNELKLRRDPGTNMCHYPTTHLSQVEQVSIRRAFGELYKAGILRRAKTVDILNPTPKQTYMINPHIIKCWEYKKALEIWQYLVEGEKR